MAKLVHFELTSTDPGATAAFYARVLGWKAAPSPFVPDYQLLTAPHGVSGAAMSSRYQPQPAILWFEVEDIEACLATVTAAGGKQAGNINTIPGEGMVVYVSDPNDTVFGLKQPL